MRQGGCIDAQLPYQPASAGLLNADLSETVAALFAAETRGQLRGILPQIPPCRDGRIIGD